MSTNLTHSIPSLSGTFGIPTRLALNPKMPKEPSSPSLSNAQTDRQYIHNEIYRQRNNKGQRTTSATRQVRQQWFSVGIFPPGPG